MKVNVIIEKDKYGYYAFCPELKGCHSQGDSLDEVLENIKEQCCFIWKPYHLMKEMNI